MKNAFSSSFDKYACIGDTIEAEIDGWTVVARLEYDYDSRPQDQGFDPNDSDYGEENERICAAWKNDEWQYVGVVLSVSRDGLMISECANSLWSIEMNFPGGDNAYLTEVANELLSEAIQDAENERLIMLEKLQA